MPVYQTALYTNQRASIEKPPLNIVTGDSVIGEIVLTMFSVTGIAHNSFGSSNGVIVVPTWYKRRPVRTHVQKEIHYHRTEGKRMGGKEWIQHILTKIHREHTFSKYRNVETEEMGMAEGIT